MARPKGPASDPVRTKKTAAKPRESLLHKKDDFCLCPSGSASAGRAQFSAFQQAVEKQPAGAHGRATKINHYFVMD
ncbi:hypothetical protein [Desulfuromonas thiophila]|uniref:hypothetical protein n=1 Tax=Desulfuromonas thiophila TaxID=57664 RepID=UPI0029F51C42|nr:hypothetical protein [Desulfuromonas thiophila]